MQWYTFPKSYTNIHRNNYKKTFLNTKTRFHNLQRQALTQFIKLYQYMT